MDEKSGLRQFWLRTVLAVGILWGSALLTGVVLIFKGADDSNFDVFAAACNDLTILPACILAFWHRRAACIWLTANGVTVVTAFATFTGRTHDYRPGAIVGVGVVVLITVLLDFMELRGWPNALGNWE